MHTNLLSALVLLRIQSYPLALVVILLIYFQVVFGAYHLRTPQLMGTQYYQLILVNFFNRIFLVESIDISGRQAIIYITLLICLIFSPILVAFLIRRYSMRPPRITVRILCCILQPLCCFIYVYCSPMVFNLVSHMISYNLVMLSARWSLLQSVKALLSASYTCFGCALYLIGNSAYIISQFPSPDIRHRFFQIHTYRGVTAFPLTFCLCTLFRACMPSLVFVPSCVYGMVCSHTVLGMLRVGAFSYNYYSSWLNLVFSGTLLMVCLYNALFELAVFNFSSLADLQKVEWGLIALCVLLYGLVVVWYMRTSKRVRVNVTLSYEPLKKWVRLPGKGRLQPVRLLNFAKGSNLQVGLEERLFYDLHLSANGSTEANMLLQQSQEKLPILTCRPRASFDFRTSLSKQMVLSLLCYFDIASVLTVVLPPNYLLTVEELLDLGFGEVTEIDKTPLPEGQGESEIDIGIIQRFSDSTSDDSTPFSANELRSTTLPQAMQQQRFPQQPAQPRINEELVVIKQPSYAHQASSHLYDDDTVFGISKPARTPTLPHPSAYLLRRILKSLDFEAVTRYAYRASELLEQLRLLYENIYASIFLSYCAASQTLETVTLIDLEEALPVPLLLRYFRAWKTPADAFNSILHYISVVGEIDRLHRSHQNVDSAEVLGGKVSNLVPISFRSLPRFTCSRGCHGCRSCSVRARCARCNMKQLIPLRAVFDYIRYHRSDSTVQRPPKRVCSICGSELLLRVNRSVTRNRYHQKTRLHRYLIFLRRFTNFGFLPLRRAKRKNRCVRRRSPRATLKELEALQYYLGHEEAEHPLDPRMTNADQCRASTDPNLGLFHNAYAPPSDMCSSGSLLFISPTSLKPVVEEADDNLLKSCQDLGIIFSIFLPSLMSISSTTGNVHRLSFATSRMAGYTSSLRRLRLIALIHLARMLFPTGLYVDGFYPIQLVPGYRFYSYGPESIEDLGGRATLRYGAEFFIRRESDIEFRSLKGVSFIKKLYQGHQGAYGQYLYCLVPYLYPITNHYQIENYWLQYIHVEAVLMTVAFLGAANPYVTHFYRLIYLNSMALLGRILSSQDLATKVRGRQNNFTREVMNHGAFATASSIILNALVVSMNSHVLSDTVSDPYTVIGYVTRSSYSAQSTLTTWLFLFTQRVCLFLSYLYAIRKANKMRFRQVKSLVQQMGALQEMTLGRGFIGLSSPRATTEEPSQDLVMAQLHEELTSLMQERLVYTEPFGTLRVQDYYNLYHRLMDLHKECVSLQGYLNDPERYARRLIVLDGFLLRDRLHTFLLNYYALFSELFINMTFDLRGFICNDSIGLPSPQHGAIDILQQSASPILWVGHDTNTQHRRTPFEHFFSFQAPEMNQLKSLKALLVNPRRVLSNMSLLYDTLISDTAYTDILILDGINTAGLPDFRINGLTYSLLSILGSSQVSLVSMPQVQIERKASIDLSDSINLKDAMEDYYRALGRQALRVASLYANVTDGVLFEMTYLGLRRVSLNRLARLIASSLALPPEQEEEDIEGPPLVRLDTLQFNQTLSVRFERFMDALSTKHYRHVYPLPTLYVVHKGERFLASPLPRRVAENGLSLQLTRDSFRNLQRTLVLNLNLLQTHRVLNHFVTFDHRLSQVVPSLQNRFLCVEGCHYYPIGVRAQLLRTFQQGLVHNSNEAVIRCLVTLLSTVTTNVYDLQQAKYHHNYVNVDFDLALPAQRIRGASAASYNAYTIVTSGKSWVQRLSKPDLNIPSSVRASLTMLLRVQARVFLNSLVIPQHRLLHTCLIFDSLIRLQHTIHDDITLRARMQGHLLAPRLMKMGQDISRHGRTFFRQLQQLIDTPSSPRGLTVPRSSPGLRDLTLLRSETPTQTGLLKNNMYVQASSHEVQLARCYDVLSSMEDALQQTWKAYNTALKHGYANHDFILVTLNEFMRLLTMTYGTDEAFIHQLFQSAIKSVSTSKRSRLQGRGGKATLQSTHFYNRSLSVERLLNAPSPTSGSFGSLGNDLSTSTSIGVHPRSKSAPLPQKVSELVLTELQDWNTVPRASWFLSRINEKTRTQLYNILDDSSITQTRISYLVDEHVGLMDNSSRGGVGRSNQTRFNSPILSPLTSLITRGTTPTKNLECLIKYYIRMDMERETLEQMVREFLLLTSELLFTGQMPVRGVPLVFSQGSQTAGCHILGSLLDQGRDKSSTPPADSQALEIQSLLGDEEISKTSDSLLGEGESTCSTRQESRPGSCTRACRRRKRRSTTCCTCKCMHTQRPGDCTNVIFAISILVFHVTLIFCLLMGFAMRITYLAVLDALSNQEINLSSMLARLLELRAEVVSSVTGNVNYIADTSLRNRIMYRLNLVADAAAAVHYGNSALYNGVSINDVKKFEIKDAYIWPPLMMYYDEASLIKRDIPRFPFDDLNIVECDIPSGLLSRWSVEYITWRDPELKSSFYFPRTFFMPFTILLNIFKTAYKTGGGDSDPTDYGNLYSRDLNNDHVLAIYPGSFRRYITDLKVNIPVLTPGEIKPDYEGFNVPDINYFMYSELLANKALCLATSMAYQSFCDKNCSVPNITVDYLITSYQSMGHLLHDTVYVAWSMFAKQSLHMLVTFFLLIGFGSFVILTFFVPLKYFHSRLLLATIDRASILANYLTLPNDMLHMLAASYHEAELVPFRQYFPSSVLSRQKKEELPKYHADTYTYAEYQGFRHHFNTRLPTLKFTSTKLLDESKELLEKELEEEEEDDTRLSYPAMAAAPTIPESVIEYQHLAKFLTRAKKVSRYQVHTGLIILGLVLLLSILLSYIPLTTYFLYPFKTNDLFISNTYGQWYNITTYESNLPTNGWFSGKDSIRNFVYFLQQTQEKSEELQYVDFSINMTGLLLYTSGESYWWTHNTSTYLPLYIRQYNDQTLLYPGLIELKYVQYYNQYAQTTTKWLTTLRESDPQLADPARREAYSTVFNALVYLSRINPLRTVRRAEYLIKLTSQDPALLSMTEAFRRETQILTGEVLNEYKHGLDVLYPLPLEEQASDPYWETHAIMTANYRFMTNFPDGVQGSTAVTPITPSPIPFTPNIPPPASREIEPIFLQSLMKRLYGCHLLFYGFMLLTYFIVGWIAVCLFICHIAIIILPLLGLYRNLRHSLSCSCSARYLRSLMFSYDLFTLLVCFLIVLIFLNIPASIPTAVQGIYVCKNAVSYLTGLGTGQWGGKSFVPLIRMTIQKTMALRMMTASLILFMGGIIKLIHQQLKTTVDALGTFTPYTQAQINKFSEKNVTPFIRQIKERITIERPINESAESLESSEYDTRYREDPLLYWHGRPTPTEKIELAKTITEEFSYQVPVFCYPLRLPRPPFFIIEILVRYFTIVLLFVSTWHLFQHFILDLSQPSTLSAFYANQHIALYNYMHMHIITAVTTSSNKYFESHLQKEVFTMYQHSLAFLSMNPQLQKMGNLMAYKLDAQYQANDLAIYDDYMSTVRTYMFNKVFGFHHKLKAVDLPREWAVTGLSLPTSWQNEATFIYRWSMFPPTNRSELFDSSRVMDDWIVQYDVLGSLHAVYTYPLILGYAIQQDSFPFPRTTAINRSAHLSYGWNYQYLGLDAKKTIFFDIIREEILRGSRYCVSGARTYASALLNGSLAHLQNTTFVLLFQIGCVLILYLCMTPLLLHYFLRKVTLYEMFTSLFLKRIRGVLKTSQLEREGEGN
ncbi:hypothetical protein GMRT_14506 [Giardia muris]|uniref:Uncharacterized protein n=1 Tax=Giardia muris TaxID=5742 RepID=A0A4Z1SWM5_GIAMU|nr:hypothetical protein GMRT_14506 [Giardia muris]|eukprot:TNJ29255.1 hypothetical protein GMRT_14506 [Giardia muris]